MSGSLGVSMVHVIASQTKDHRTSWTFDHGHCCATQVTNFSPLDSRLLSRHWSRLVGQYRWSNFFIVRLIDMSCSASIACHWGWHCWLNNGTRLLHLSSMEKMQSRLLFFDKIFQKFSCSSSRSTFFRLKASYSTDLPKWPVPLFDGD